MSRRKQMDEKIHHRQYRFSVITIEGAHQQYDHDLKRRRKKKKKSEDSLCYPSIFAIEVLIKFLLKFIKVYS